MCNQNNTTYVGENQLFLPIMQWPKILKTLDIRRIKCYILLQFDIDGAITSMKWKKDQRKEASRVTQHVLKVTGSEKKV